MTKKKITISIDENTLKNLDTIIKDNKEKNYNRSFLINYIVKREIDIWLTEHYLKS